MGVFTCFRGMSELPEMPSEKPRSYLVRTVIKTSEDFGAVEIFSEIGGGILIAIFAWAFGLANRTELHELIFLCIGGAIIVPLFGFLIRLVFITPAKIDRELKSRLEIAESKLKPKFKLSCNKDITGCAIENPNGSMKFFRLQVETDCIDGIKECKGHLIKIEKDGVVVYDHDAVELPFARAEETDSLAKTIFPSVPYFLDVLVTYNPVHAVNFATKGHFPALNQNREYIFAKTGEYILTVGVSGKGVPTVKTRLKFDWKGQWFTATIEQIDDSGFVNDIIPKKSGSM